MSFCFRYRAIRRRCFRGVFGKQNRSRFTLERHGVEGGTRRTTDTGCNALSALFVLAEGTIRGDRGTRTIRLSGFPFQALISTDTVDDLFAREAVIGFYTCAGFAIFHLPRRAIISAGCAVPGRAVRTISNTSPGYNIQLFTFRTIGNASTVIIENLTRSAGGLDARSRSWIIKIPGPVRMRIITKRNTCIITDEKFSG